MAVQFRLPPEAVLSTSVANLASGTLNFYEDDTLVATTVYADTARGTPTGVSGVVTLDSVGQHGPIYLPNAIVRCIIKNSAGTTIANGDFDVNGIDTEDIDIMLEHTSDGGGSVLSTGVKGDKRCDITGTIIRWTIEADQSGSCEWDIWKKPFVANSPPTVANTIVASDQPTLTTAQSATGTSLTGWTNTVTAGDTFRFKLNSVSTITRCTLSLTIRRTVDV